jgi:putative flavoprotein involved in K+ transport
MSEGRAGIIDAVIIGAGHSGLAMSRVLSERGVEHIVLDRGQVASAWRRERWDSLRLLTPNWMTRLPGYAYAGDDPNGYMTSREVAEWLAHYAKWASAPVISNTTVTGVAQSGAGYHVATTRGNWLCRALVLATGAFSRPVVPEIAQGIPCEVEQLHAHAYRNPQQLAAGRVLIVGASASGVQLASEIQQSGRPVTLAVGEHVRLPRVYRARDIQWWMHTTGLLDRRIEEEDDPGRARRVPSPQLAGTPGVTLDLNRLQQEGVEVVGRLVGIRDDQAQFSGSLRNTCDLADLKLNRLLTTIDQWVLRHGGVTAAAPSERYAPTSLRATPRLGLNLRKEVRTVLWATGLRPDYPWLHVPVFNAKGELRHQGGVVDAPGLYVLGLPYLRRRKSSFIHGAEDDARELGEHMMLSRFGRHSVKRVQTHC